MCGYVCLSWGLGLGTGSGYYSRWAHLARYVSLCAGVCVCERTGNSDTQLSENMTVLVVARMNRMCSVSAPITHTHRLLHLLAGRLYMAYELMYNKKEHDSNY